jgi:hypothetical protein
MVAVTIADMFRFGQPTAAEGLLIYFGQWLIAFAIFLAGSLLDPVGLRRHLDRHVRPMALKPLFQGLVPPFLVLCRITFLGLCEAISICILFTTPHLLHGEPPTQRGVAVLFGSALVCIVCHWIWSYRDWRSLTRTLGQVLMEQS